MLHSFLLVGLFGYCYGSHEVRRLCLVVAMNPSYLAALKGQKKITRRLGCIEVDRVE